MAKFEQYSNSPQSPPIIARGAGQDVVFVGYAEKEEALRALQAVRQDEEFPEIQVAPASKV